MIAECERESLCNCSQALLLDKQAALYAEALGAIKAALVTVEPGWDDQRRIRWVGSIVALAEANLSRLK